MSSEAQTVKAPIKVRIWILAALCIFAVLLWGANWYFVSKYVSDATKQGQFGDMFGAVNALFTALAFAGLIYTVMLQRDQLALQQQEIIESGKTQEQLVQRQIDAQDKLFERQKTFQEDQRQKQIEHELKLEQLRQEFEEIVEHRRKDRESQAHAEFERNVLRALRRELEALGEIYDKGIGSQLAQVPAGQTFNLVLGLTQDPFTVYPANAVHLGRVDGIVSRQIISVYAMMKALIEEYRINNQYLFDLLGIESALQVNPEDQSLLQRRTGRIGWMIHQTERLRQTDGALKRAVAELYSLLDQREIK